MGENPDLAQAHRVLAGDRSAFDGLFDRYADRVYRFAHRRAGNEAEAQELTRQMLERIFRELPSYRGEVALDAWVLVKCRAALAAAAPTAPRPRQGWDNPPPP